MYIKEKLVFDKHTGTLTGFLDLGDVTTHLMDYEQQLAEQSKVLPRRQVAKTIVVLMVRGYLLIYIFLTQHFLHHPLKAVIYSHSYGMLLKDLLDLIFVYLW